jgi:hypothetical protein
MQRKRTNTLEDRAAAYFGFNGESKGIIKIDRWACFIVAPTGKSATRLAYYREDGNGNVRSDFWYLDEAKRKKLEAALSV